MKSKLMSLVCALAVSLVLPTQADTQQSHYAMQADNTKEFDIIAAEVNRYLDEVMALAQIQSQELVAITLLDKSLAQNITAQRHKLEQRLNERDALFANIIDKFDVERVCQLAKQSYAIARACSRKDTIIDSLDTGVALQKEQRDSRKNKLAKINEQLLELAMADDESLEAAQAITALLIDKRLLEQQNNAARIAVSVSVKEDVYGTPQPAFGRGTRASARTIKGRVRLL
ncbi:hypothetical protein AADZ84_11940 [Colwelliaceae bacterium MEBiC 14330]